MELIARDQLGKLHGQINRRKQESLGIDEYEWETSHDERVRESRRERQGKVFSWSKPPPKVIRAIRFAAAALHSLSLTGTGSGAVEREVIANIMTICYTRNKKGLELIRAIPSLQALLKEVEAAYDVSHG